MKYLSAIKRALIVGVAALTLGLATIPATQASVPTNNGAHTVSFTSDKTSCDSGQETHG